MKNSVVKTALIYLVMASFAFTNIFNVTVFAEDPIPPEWDGGSAIPDPTTPSVNPDDIDVPPGPTFSNLNVVKYSGTAGTGILTFFKDTGAGIITAKIFSDTGMLFLQGVSQGTTVLSKLLVKSSPTADSIFTADTAVPAITLNAPTTIKGVLIAEENVTANKDLEVLGSFITNILGVKGYIENPELPDNVKKPLVVKDSDGFNVYAPTQINGKTLISSKTDTPKVQLKVSEEEGADGNVSRGSIVVTPDGSPESKIITSLDVKDGSISLDAKEEASRALIMTDNSGKAGIAAKLKTEDSIGMSELMVVGDGAVGISTKHATVDSVNGAMLLVNGIDGSLKLVRKPEGVFPTAVGVFIGEDGTKVLNALDVIDFIINTRDGYSKAVLATSGAMVRHPVVRHVLKYIAGEVVTVDNNATLGQSKTFGNIYGITPGVLKKISTKADVQLDTQLSALPYDYPDDESVAYDSAVGPTIMSDNGIIEYGDALNAMNSYTINSKLMKVPGNDVLGGNVNEEDTEATKSAQKIEYKRAVGEAKSAEPIKMVSSHAIVGETAADFPIIELQNAASLEALSVNSSDYVNKLEVEINPDLYQKFSDYKVTTSTDSGSEITAKVGGDSFQVTGDYVNRLTDASDIRSTDITADTIRRVVEAARSGSFKGLSREKYSNLILNGGAEVERGITNLGRFLFFGKEEFFSNPSNHFWDEDNPSELPNMPVMMKDNVDVTGPTVFTAKQDLIPVDDKYVVKIGQDCRMKCRDKCSEVPDYGLFVERLLVKEGAAQDQAADATDERYMKEGTTTTYNTTKQLYSSKTEVKTDNPLSYLNSEEYTQCYESCWEDCSYGPKGDGADSCEEECDAAVTACKAKLDPEASDTYKTAFYARCDEQGEDCKVQRCGTPAGGTIVDGCPCQTEFEDCLKDPDYNDPQMTQEVFCRQKLDRCLPQYPECSGGQSCQEVCQDYSDTCEQQTTIASHIEACISPKAVCLAQNCGQGCSDCQAKKQSCEANQAGYSQCQSEYTSFQTSYATQLAIVNTDLTALNVNLASFDSQIADKTAEISRLNTQLSGIDTKILQAQSTITTLTQDKLTLDAALQSQNATLSAQIKTLEADIKSLTDAKNASLLSLQSLAAERDNLYSQSLAAHKTYTDSLNTLNGLKTDLGAATSTFNSLTADVNTKTTAVNTASSNLATKQSALQGLQTQLSTANTQKTSLSNTLSGYQTQLASANSQKTTLSAQIGTLNTEKAALSTQFNSLATQISGLNSTLSGYQTEKANKLNDVSAINTALGLGKIFQPEIFGLFRFNLPVANAAALRGGVPKVEVSILKTVTFGGSTRKLTPDQLRSEKDVLNLRVNQLTTLISQTTSQRDGLVTQKSTIATQIAGKTTDITNKTNQLATVNSTITNLTTLSANTTAALAAKTSEISTLAASRDSAATAVTTAQTDYNQKLAVLNTAQSSLASATATKNDLTGKVGTAQSLSNKLLGDYNTVYAQYQAADVKVTNATNAFNSQNYDSKTSAKAADLTRLKAQLAASSPELVTVMNQLTYQNEVLVFNQAERINVVSSIDAAESSLSQYTLNKTAALSTKAQLEGFRTNVGVVNWSKGIYNGSPIDNGFTFTDVCVQNVDLTHMEGTHVENTAFDSVYLGDTSDSGVVCPTCTEECSGSTNTGTTTNVQKMMVSQYDSTNLTASQQCQDAASSYCGGGADSVCLEGLKKMNCLCGDGGYCSQAAFKNELDSQVYDRYCSCSGGGIGGFDPSRFLPEFFGESKSENSWLGMDRNEVAAVGSKLFLNYDSLNGVVVGGIPTGISLVCDEAPTGGTGLQSTISAASGMAPSEVTPYLNLVSSLKCQAIKNGIDSYFADASNPAMQKLLIAYAISYVYSTAADFGFRDELRAYFGIKDIVVQGGIPKNLYVTGGVFSLFTASAGVLTGFLYSSTITANVLGVRNAAVQENLVVGKNLLVYGNVSVAGDLTVFGNVKKCTWTTDNHLTGPYNCKDLATGEWTQCTWDAGTKSHTCGPLIFDLQLQDYGNLQYFQGVSLDGAESTGTGSLSCAQGNHCANIQLPPNATVNTTTSATCNSNQTLNSCTTGVVDISNGNTITQNVVQTATKNVTTKTCTFAFKNLTSNVNYWGQGTAHCQ